MRLAIVCLLAGCIDPIDPRWDLEHEQVIAVRASPPRIAPGEHARLDALVARAGRAVVEAPAEVSAPGSGLEDAVKFDGTTWQVTAPDAARIASLRPALGLAPDAPVPVDLLLVFQLADGPRYVKKTVWLGESGDNPALPAITVDGEPAAPALAIATGRDVYVEAAAAPELRVNWLTSCGTLFQDDVARAFVRADEPDDGELAIVIRDRAGGVVWSVWPLTAR